MSLPRISVLVPFPMLVFLAVSAHAQKIYWTDLTEHKIQRANLDGSDLKDIVTFSGKNCPCHSGLALDLSDGRIYWADEVTRAIWRSNLDGSAVEDFMSTGLVRPIGIALDPGESKVYWTDSRDINKDDGKIQRANMDGTNVEDLVTGIYRALDIALDVSTGKMYWVHDSIPSLAIDIEDLLDHTLIFAEFVPNDAVAGSKTAKIQRANLDGTGVEDLLTNEVACPVGIDLDARAGKMYWVDFGARKIQRANLDGSGIEDLVTGLNTPEGIALDLSAGKMYWTDRGTHKIQRADLDGSNIEDLVTGLSWPHKIALDPP